jgi:hypothetical protein
MNAHPGDECEQRDEKNASNTDGANERTHQNHRGSGDG